MKKNTILIVLILISLVMLGVLVFLIMRPVIEEREGANTTSVATEASTTAATETIPTETEPPYVPEIYPDVVGLYIPANDGTKDRVKVTEFTSNWEAKKDIDCFEVLASSDERVGGTSFAEMWKTVWESHENGQDGKIAYHLTISMADGSTIDRIIRKPTDAEDFQNYLEVYLYDDINQVPGVRYTHLSDSEINSDTILSSIKLTCGKDISQVKEIELFAFIYNSEDCFGTDGAYLGKVIANVIIREE